MGEKFIVKCRVCKSDKLGMAFNVNKIQYYFCKLCCALQQKNDIPFQIDFDLSQGAISVPYYPAFLEKHDTEPLTSDRVLFYSLVTVEHLLYSCGYEVTDAWITGYDLCVTFQPLPQLKRLRKFEQKKRIDNQFTFFLWAVQFKK